jgi:hypothetical protein
MLRRFSLSLTIFTMTLLIISPLFLSTKTPYSAAAAAQSEPQSWKAYYMVGQFLFNNPPKPDQIFKIYYRVINGTIENFTTIRHSGFFGNSTSPPEIVANVSSSSSALLEMKIPRNYPFINIANSTLISVPGSLRGNFVIDVHPQSGTAQRIFDKPPFQTVSDCFYNYSVPFSGKATITMSNIILPEIFPFEGENVPSICIAETLVQVPTMKDGSISPLQQFKYPELVIRSDGMPYCVSQNMLAFLHKVWSSFTVMTLPKLQ